MFKVLKGPRGNGNICMLMRVVTDFNIFDIGILQIFVFVFFLYSCLSESHHFSLDLFNYPPPISTTQL